MGAVCRSSKKDTRYVNENTLTGTVCDNTHYIYKAKDKGKVTWWILFLKRFLKPISTSADHQTGSTSYSYWISNKKFIKTVIMSACFNM